jgi:membrane protease YdiL (CAAX protease family)
MASSGTQPASATESEVPPQPGIPSQRRWVDLGLVLLVGIAPLVVQAVFQLFSAVQPFQGVSNLQFANGLVHEIVTLVLLIYVLTRQQRTLRSIGFGFQWPDLPKGLGLFVGCWLSWVSVSMTISYAHWFWTQEPLSQPYRDPKVIFGGGSLTLFLVYACLAPLFEETIVRGYLMTELIGLSWRPWAAALVSLGLQTTYHLYYGFWGALIVGAGMSVLAIYFARSRRIVPVIIAHLLWDLAAIYGNWHR